MEVLGARPSRRAALTVLGGVAMLAAASCGSAGASGGSVAGVTASAPAAAAQLPASQCDKATGFTLYSSQGYDSDAAKAFQAQTGIATKLVDDSTGPLLAKIAAEGSNPQWDAVWFDGNVTMQGLDSQGYLLKWTSSNIGNFTAQGAALIPADHGYYPTGITAAGVIVYNKDKASATLPTDWSDLTKSQYSGMTAMNDPAYSGPSYPFIAGVAQAMGGETQGKAFYTALKKNGLAIFQTNDPTLSSVKTGAKAFGIIQDSAYYGAVAGGAHLGVIYPKSGVAELPSEIGLSANGSHQACTQQFVAWLQSAAGQAVLTHHDPTDGDTYFIDIINGVTPVVQRQTTGINFIKLDVTRWSAAESELKKWFHDNVVNG